MKKLGKVLLGLFVLALCAGTVLYFYFPRPLYHAALAGERLRSGLGEREVVIGEFHWKYLEGGEGEPLLLLHGFGGDKDHWTRMAKGLTSRYRVIAPDLPGFGENTRDISLSYSVEDEVARLEDFVQRLGLKGFHLAGNSMGGHIAATYAVRHPEMVRSLVLISPSGVDSSPLSEFQERLAQGENLLLVRNADDYRKMMDLGFYRQPYIPQPILKYLAQRAIADQPLQQKLSVDYKMKSIPLDQEAAKITAPTLILWGERDRLMNPQGAAIVQGLIPNSRRVMLPDVGHVAMIEQPERTARIFLDFLGSLEKS